MSYAADAFAELLLRSKYVLPMRSKARCGADLFRELLRSGPSGPMASLMRAFAKKNGALAQNN